MGLRLLDAPPGDAATIEVMRKERPDLRGGTMGAPLPIPGNASAETIAVPAERGPGHWVGAPSALVHEDVHYVAYRQRRPVDDGRGGDVIVARVAPGGRTTELCRIDKLAMDAESLERPALMVDNSGRWRLYLSCATTGTRHWRVEVLQAASPSGFLAADRRVVLPGNQGVAMKDPVILHDGRGWRAWICCHPLDDPEATDRMWTEFASSEDGFDWTLHGPALQPAAGRWDQRGMRVTAILQRTGGVVAFYDGRASAAENWEERTGVAAGHPEHLEPVGDAPVAQASGAYPALRYAAVVDDGDRTAVYYEIGCEDGSHELRREWFLLRTTAR